MAYIEQTKRTQEIHRQIVTVCKYLRTKYKGKKHGGYDIYEDDRVYIETDTYVSNVSCQVVLPDGKETVFSASYFHQGSHGGGPSTYHPGKWEGYLEELYKKALTEKDRQEKARAEVESQKQAGLDASASTEADAVF